MELEHLPFDELLVIRVDRAGEPSPIGQEPETFPIVVEIDVVEESDDLARVCQSFDLVIRASILLQYRDGLFVPAFDPLRECDRTVPGRVGPDRKEDVESSHPLETADGIGYRVSPHVADMKIAGDAWICKDHEEMGLRGICIGIMELLFAPSLLPFLLDLSEVECHLVLPSELPMDNDGVIKLFCKFEIRVNSHNGFGVIGYQPIHPDFLYQISQFISR